MTHDVKEGRLYLDEVLGLLEALAVVDWICPSVVKVLDLTTSVISSPS